MAKNTKKEIDSLTYEQALLELEEIVNQLEGDSPSLEESLELFERGQALSKRCAGLLEQAELKIKQLNNSQIIEEGES